MPTSVRARTRLPTRSRGPSCGSPSRACLVSGEVSGLPHALLSGDRSVHAPLALRGSPLLGTVSGELLPLLVGEQGLVEVSDDLHLVRHAAEDALRSPWPPHRSRRS